MGDQPMVKTLPPWEQTQALGDKYDAIAKIRRLSAAELGAHRVSRLLAVSVKGCSAPAAAKIVRRMADTLAYRPSDEQAQGALAACEIILQALESQ